MADRCKDGKHSLEVITSFGPEHDFVVVRWCSFCGGVVIDKEYDGRISPGVIMKMKFPECHNQKRSFLSVVKNEMINGTYRFMCPICTESNEVTPDSKALLNCSSCGQSLMVIH